MIDVSKFTDEGEEERPRDAQMGSAQPSVATDNGSPDDSGVDRLSLGQRIGAKDTVAPVRAACRQSTPASINQVRPTEHPCWDLRRDHHATDAARGSGRLQESQPSRPPKAASGLREALGSKSRRPEHRQAHLQDGLGPTSPRDRC